MHLLSGMSIGSSGSGSVTEENFITLKSSDSIVLVILLLKFFTPFLRVNYFLASCLLTILLLGIVFNFKDERRSVT